MTAFLWPLTVLTLGVLAFVWAWRFIGTRRALADVKAECATTVARQTKLAETTDKELERLRNLIQVLDNRTGGAMADRMRLAKAQQKAG